MSRWLLVMAVLLLACIAAADVVVLVDGTRLEGSIQKIPSGWAVTTPGGQRVEIEMRQVRSIEFIAPAMDDDAALSRLLSLRRATENLGSIPAAIERFEQFIRQHAGTPAAAEAQRDVALWQDRLDRGLVRFNGKWITPEEREHLLRTAREHIEQAAIALAEGRRIEADRLVQSALDVSGEAPAALYLRGLLLMDSGQVPAARKAWERVAQGLAEHGPTLNNIAVAAWRQKQYAAAMHWFDRAMLAMPSDQLVLDNVVEALHELPSEAEMSAAGKRVQRRFAEQETVLEARMKERGLYRWGSKWLDSEEIQRVEAARQEINRQLAELAAEFEQLQQKRVSLEANIDATDDAVDRAAADAARRWYDVYGTYNNIVYPPSYYLLRRDRDALIAQREDLQRQAASIQARAQAVQAQEPVPPFSGVMRIIGVEGVPRAPSDLGSGEAGNNPGEVNQAR